VEARVDWIEAVVLALVQGLTEFLPISSSAHLILVPRFLGWADQGLAFDVAVHLGTLAAVLIYFRAELGAIFRAWLGSLFRRRTNEDDARLGWSLLLATVPIGLGGLLFHDSVESTLRSPLVIALLLATVPIGLGGLLFHDSVESTLRSPLVIALATGIFGVLLGLVDRRGGVGRNEYTVTFGIAILIGLAQVLALIPGTSRSGITITAGLALGLSRQAAARFSFLLAVPVIALAAMLELGQLLQQAAPVQWGTMALAMLVAGLSAYACIGWFLRALERVSMWPFAIYRVLLAGVIFVAFT
jgi:undecaprenyl-diphosphatase